MDRHAQSTGKRWLTWTCSLVLLIAASAGAMHVCGLGFSSPTLHNAGSLDTTATHSFCAICNLAHSPSLVGIQFALLPTVRAEKHASALLQTHARLSETFALYVRPPPQA